MATTRNRSNTQITVSSAGAINYPAQPAMLATYSANASNQTGDGTIVTLIPDSVIYNVGSGYNNSTGIFTAPATGKYLVRLNVGVSSLGAAHTSMISKAIATSRTFTLLQLNPGSMRSSGNIIQWGSSLFVDMNVSDTLYMTVVVSGSTKTVGLVGTLERTYFSVKMVV